MSITANIAPRISTIQTKSFYFTIVFDVDDGNIDDGSFSLTDNIRITGSTDISISDLTLLYIQGNFVVIAVDLPNLVTGSFTIDVQGNISIDDVDNEIVGSSKTIKYDTTIPSDDTYDTTPPPGEPTAVEITLSTPSISNSGIVIAQFDFDYSVPYFLSSHVTVSTGATKSAAESIDDDFTRWIILITVPSSGQGMLDISVNEDAIGFTHDAVSAQVQHDETIALTILDADTSLSDRTQLNAEPMVGELFEYVMEVKGDNVQTVDVKGVLQPFYHHWDSTNGKLYIRSVGEVENKYDDFNFRVAATDDNGSAQALGTLNTPMAVAPAIIKPTDDLQMFFGEAFDVLIEITNNPTKANADGTWLGLTSRLQEGGLAIFGDIPVKGSKAGQFIPGVNKGEFLITASNQGGDATSEKVKWSLINLVKPIFGTIVSSYDVLTNTDFDTTLDVSGDPEPTIAVESGSLPTGLSISLSRSGTTTTISFSGQPTAAGTFTFKLKATNAAGVTISSEYTIRVYSMFSAPSSKLTNLPTNQIFLQKAGDFPIDMNMEYINRGNPPGIYTLEDVRDPPHYAITEDGILSLTTLGLSAIGVRPITVVCTNNQGDPFSHTYQFYPL